MGGLNVYIRPVYNSPKSILYNEFQTSLLPPAFTSPHLYFPASREGFMMIDD